MLWPFCLDLQWQIRALWPEGQGGHGLSRPSLGKEERKEDLGCQAVHTTEMEAGPEVSKLNRWESTLLSTW